MTLQAAISAAPLNPDRPTLIRVPPGFYREKVVVDRPVRLVGEDSSTTIVSWDDSAQKQYPDGSLYGTFATATLLVGANGFEAENLTFENTAGPGDKVGQALAAYVDADRAVFRDCRFLGSQDTLFTGPLPPFPLTIPTFGGPRGHLPRRPTRQYYVGCFIEGDVDFIFGSATAVFEGCHIRSLARETGYITAASTPVGVAHGYVFLDCSLTGSAPPQSVYLGRPWRDHAQTIFARCELGAHIRTEGWHDWDKPAAQALSFYAEAGNTGPGARGERTAWSHRLTAAQVHALTPSKILAGQDGWNPSRAKMTP